MHLKDTVRFDYSNTLPKSTHGDKDKDADPSGAFLPALKILKASINHQIQAMVIFDDEL